MQAFAAAAMAGLLVGAALVSTKAVVADVGPGLLGFLRYLIGLAILLPFALRSMRAIPARDLLPVVLVGMGQFGVQLGLLNIALLYASSARVALIFAMLPVATLFVGVALGRAWPGRTAAFGGALTVLGVAVSLWRKDLFDAAGGEWIGIAVAMAATATGAVCSLLFQPYLRRHGSFPVGVVATAASLLPLGLLALAETAGTPVSGWSAAIWANVGFVGIVSGLGFMLWLYALTHADAARVTAFLSLSPITAALLAWALLGDMPGWNIVPALALVSAGLLLASRVPRNAAPVVTDPGA